MKTLRKILYNNVLYTFLSILIGFLIGAVLLLLAGISPLTAYGKLLEGVFSQPKFLVWSVIYASPLIFTGLSVAFSFRTGVFNIGAEGQFVVGAIAACVVGITVQAPKFLHILLCFGAAMLAGALWGAVVGLLKVKRGINEVLSYIMFNWIAFYLSNYIVNLKGIRGTGGGEATANIADSARILLPKWFAEKTGCASVNAGILLAVFVAFLIWFIINKTTMGYTLRAVGFNLHAARYGGINTNRATLTAMSISGALAALGGAVQLMGMTGRISQFASQEGYGFEGITVALIAGSNPVGCIFSGLFYGAMKYGGTKLSLVGAPSEVVNIIMGTIILFIAVSHLFKHFITSRLEARDAAKVTAASNTTKGDQAHG